MSQRSVSAVDIILETNENQFIKCELKRHLSPKTVGQITRALPLHGNAHFLGKSAMYFETSIESGIERSKNVFKKGDLVTIQESKPISKLKTWIVSEASTGDDK